MKNNLKTLTLALLVMAASCSDDESTTNNDQVDDQTIDIIEDTPLEANTVADNVVIAGGTKNDGTPPTPNNAISLDVSGSSETAFLNEGFNVSIASDGSVSGAYLVFKSNDGVASDSYYDIDLAANGLNNKNDIISPFRVKRNRKASKQEDEVSLDVDFNSEIEPGTFCYEICVYDAAGNISAPEEVCVTVESWGGNSALVASWEATKEQSIYDGEQEEFIIGERDDCYEETIFCNNEDEITATLCYIQDYGYLEINVDGTFSVDFKATHEELDYDASEEACDAIIDAWEYRFQVEGYWAYVDDESRLTLIGYDWNVLEDGETEIETLPSGEGELVFDGQAEIIGNELIITETFEDFGFEEVYKIFFEKR